MAHCPKWWFCPGFTQPYGYGSIPINTIFRGMNIHLPAILMFTRGTIGFDTLPCQDTSTGQNPFEPKDENPRVEAQNATSGAPTPELHSKAAGAAAFSGSCGWESKMVDISLGISILDGYINDMYHLMSIEQINVLGDYMYIII
jgi:hypothetical protein